MIRKFLARAHRNQRGITGLETAIILIAFVVVAAVFAYTVLSAGIFSSQKSSESVYAGLNEAQCALEIKGSVIAVDGSTVNGQIGNLRVILGLANQGESVNFTVPTDTSGGGNGIADPGSSNVVVVSIITSNLRVDDIAWSVTVLGGDGDVLLEDNELFLIQVGGATDATNGLEAALSTNTLSASEQFTLELKPPTGSTLIIERTLPDVIDAYNDLK